MSSGLLDFEFETLEIRTDFKVLKSATRFQLDMSFGGSGKCAAQVKVLFCPVHIEDPVLLAATPTKVEGDLLAKFQPDEVDSRSPERIVPNLEKQIVQSATLLAEGYKRFFIHHQRCEVADQWSWIEIPSLTESAREQMSLEQSKHIPELRKGLSRPLWKLNAELKRPYFVFEEGKIETKAYLWQERLTFVHQMFSARSGSEAHATVIEQL